MREGLIVNGELLLYGDVGDPFGWGDGFTPTDVAEALAALGDGPVTARLNSGGGIATDGMAIYSLMKTHGGIRIVVDGVAASAASLIFMAGDTREMRDGSVLMIHDPSALTVGTAADHRKAVEWLDKLGDQYAGVYARASGKSRESVRAIMQAETWLSADDAVGQGFATAKVKEAAAKAAAYDYRVYLNAPQGLPERSKAAHPIAAMLALSNANLARMPASPTAPTHAEAARARMRMRAAGL